VSSAASPSRGEKFVRVRVALERGQRDDRLLGGRGYDDHYWRSAKAALTNIGRELDKAASERDALLAVIDGE
jgi:hypothetical protein